MSYELRLAEAAEQQIRRYIRSRFDTAEHRRQAADAIEAELDKLADNPHLGSAPKGAFGRPIYLFHIHVAGATRYLRVVYNYTIKEDAVLVIGFAPVDF